MDKGEPVTTASGLKYWVLTPGTGTAHPKRGDLVMVHYTGWLTDGTEFDSSRRRGDAARFAVGQLIEGWNEALTLMTEGARWKLAIPAVLGYGASGAPPRIPANADLVFDVELVGFQSVPEFRAPAKEGLKRTPGGTGYEVLAPGKGDPCGPEASFELEYAFWTPSGELLECSVSSGRTIAGGAGDMALPFLKELPALLREGEEVLAEVPFDQGFGKRGGMKLPEGTPSIWRLKLVRIGRPKPAPEFVLPKEEEMEVLPSGLKVRTLREGAGEAPKMGQQVVVHYTGWLTDGKVFDSSVVRGLPATFRLGEVIPGWNEGLQRMKPGGEALLVIPASLGYGVRGAGDRIPPGATLVFRVELLEVKK